MKLVLVHDYLYEYGGAERVLEALHELWPDAPIYTSLYDPAAMPASFRSWDIRTSWLQRLPRAQRYAKLLFLLYPFAFRQFDLRGYDVVLSISAYMAKAAHAPDGVHVGYVLTPPRFLWGYGTFLRWDEMHPLVRAPLPPLLRWLRRIDRRLGRRLDRVVAISEEVRRRVQRVYRRDADVIYPPVGTARLREARPVPGPYYLVLSRLGASKRVDLAIEACNRLRLPLKIVGTGTDEQHLRGLAGPTVEFLGRLSDAEAAGYLAGCQALLFPGAEDFGIVPVEAQAAGRPVIALGEAGALETVSPGVTGELFRPDTVAALVDVLSSFEPSRYDPARCRDNAARFDTAVFQEQMRWYVQEATRSA